MEPPEDDDYRDFREDYDWLRREMELTAERAQERGMEPRHFVACLQFYTQKATESLYEAAETAEEGNRNQE